MKNFIRKIVSIALILSLSAAVLIGFTGCSSGKTYIDKDGNITLSYWSIYPVGDPLYDWQQTKIKEFTAANPTIKIEYTGISFWDYFSKILVSQNNAKGPDIFVQTVTDNGLRSGSNISLNLKPYFDDSLNEDMFSETDKKALSHNGGVYGVPYSTDGRLFYYNIDHLNELKESTDAQWTATKAAKKAGTTITGKPTDLIAADGNVRGPKSYDEIMAMSELLTKRQGGNASGKIERLGFDVNIGNNSIVNFIWNMGGECFDANQNPIVNKNANVKLAYQTWYDIARVHPIADVNGFVDSGASASSTESFFWNGTVSMMIATNEIPWKNDKLGDNAKINLGACSIPYTKEEYRSNFSGGFSLEVTNRLAKEDKRVADAAYKFISFMMSDKTQTEVLTQTSNMPGKAAIYDDLMLSEKDKVKQIVIEEMNYRRPFDFIPKASQWWGPLFTNLTDYVSGKKTIEKALDDAQKGIEKLIAMN